MKIELLYFDGCPSYETAALNLKEALRAEGLPAEFEMVRVVSEEDARRKQFPGSPTIRVNGEDIEGPAAQGRGHAYGCRIYSEGGGPAGWPSVERIRSAVRAALS